MMKKNHYDFRNRVDSKTSDKLYDRTQNLMEELDNDKRSDRKTGVILFFNRQRGFGQIMEDGSGTKVFLHISKIISSLLEAYPEDGRSVSYETIQTSKGIQAVNVIVS